ncbi:MAG: Maf family protein [Arenicella sp.]
MQQTLILASSSPYRKMLLEKLTRDFICVSPEIDETPLANETAQQLVQRLATEKAQAIAKQYPQGLIIGSDQVAIHGQSIVGKPGNHERAVQQLLSVSAKHVTLYTGLTLLNAASGKIQSTVVPFQVKFRELTLETIEAYLKADQPYQCAGSVKVESLGIALLEKMTGDDPNALIGLPLIELVTMLNHENFSIFTT